MVCCCVAVGWWVIGGGIDVVTCCVVASILCVADTCLFIHMDYVCSAVADATSALWSSVELPESLLSLPGGLVVVAGCGGCVAMGDGGGCGFEIAIVSVDSFKMLLLFKMLSFAAIISSSNSFVSVGE